MLALMGLSVHSFEQAFLCMLKTARVELSNLGWFQGPSGVFFGVFPEIQTVP
ncbi:MAG: hypothetical protein HRT36_01880 [Alphaproteobacteria bacterium]|nr:hypothetical protein [Alphaproteobacteria bacterium]